MNASAKAAPSIEGADNRGQTTVLMLGGQLLAEFSLFRQATPDPKRSLSAYESRGDSLDRRVL